MIESGKPPVLSTGVSDVYGHGWDTLKKYFPEMLLLFFLQMLLAMPMSLIEVFVDPESFGYAFFTLFNIAYALIIMTPVNYGAAWLCLKATRGEPFRVTDVFFAFQQFGNVVLSAILMGAIIGIGLVLLVIPGIIFACKLAFVPYLVMDEKLEAVEAVRRSWSMTRGFTGNIFLMGVAAFFIIILGLICLLVGVIPAAIWISLSFASIFLAVSTHLKSFSLQV